MKSAKKIFALFLKILVNYEDSLRTFSSHMIVLLLLTLTYSPDKSFYALEDVFGRKMRLIYDL
ncbi:hypothetical protein, partial [Athalassotoga sp.]|uniref:hypothetical protein n=1 Tax=Athalassotoga sp. TaxID=2022597 RepID=UPI003D083BA5